MPLTPEHEVLRLDCLRLALSDTRRSPAETVRAAGLFFNFVTGLDRAALASEAKAAIDRMAG